MNLKCKVFPLVTILFSYSSFSEDKSISHPLDINTTAEKTTAEIKAPPRQIPPKNDLEAEINNVSRKFISGDPNSFHDLKTYIKELITELYSSNEPKNKALVFNDYLQSLKQNIDVKFLTSVQMKNILSKMLEHSKTDHKLPTDSPQAWPARLEKAKKYWTTKAPNPRSILNKTLDLKYVAEISPATNPSSGQLNKLAEILSDIAGE